ncbi:MAG: phenylalanine--tRNA ligase subunit beta [Rhizobiaceae bacterium]|nr:phenylalanine--tRNA ligase subunit beta [Rhizobiaceae bacterium]
MKFTLSWLKDHLETDASLEQIIETLNLIGLEVEDVDDKSQFAPFKIAKVLSAEKHPDADKLRVLMVDTGDGDPVQVVCGAPNARADMLGAFAAPGTYVPGIDITLAVGKIRGVESHGMMCSERELEMSDSHDGIIDLPTDAPVGTSFADYAGLNDPVIEIGITPNRPDALGVAGIARDLAAAGLGSVKPLKISKPHGTGPCPVDVKLDFDAAKENLCPAFGLQLVKGVKNGPSPAWMQQRLIAIGLRPISALVDITNYVTYDLGRPLHVFDADRVKGDLVVRRGRESEGYLGLDGKEYKVTDKICVITDDNGVESLAGIMGGEESGCQDDTVNVLVESALWDPMNIARTGRDLGINTDARYRFERGVDPQFMEDGLAVGTNWVLELCGGEATEALIVGEVPNPEFTIEFPVSEVQRLTGIEVASSECADILTRLGFGVEGTGEILTVKVPTWRPDVFGKADLVEEVMRIHGVNNIEPQPLPATGAVGSKILTLGQTRARNARRALASRGMLEAVTWSFIPASHAEAFGGGSEACKLANPISSEMSDMRPSLLPGLIAAAGRNHDRGNADVAIFEVASTYLGDTPDTQHRIAGGIRKGTAKYVGGGRDWREAGTAVDVYDAKADALSVLEAAGMDSSKVQIVAGGPEWFHPGRCGTIQLGPKVILGHFGEVHPMTLETLDVAGPIAAFEVMLENIPAPRKKATKTKTPLDISDLQSVNRDFAFVVDKSCETASLLRAAAGADKNLISNVSVFDVFEGASLGEDKKSIAIEVTLQPKDKTLTEEDIAAISSKVVANVEKTTGGSLRG